MARPLHDCVQLHVNSPSSIPILILRIVERLFNIKMHALVAESSKTTTLKQFSRRTFHLLGLFEQEQAA